MKRPHAPTAAARRVRGLTLIELLVSLAIGLALMIAIVSAYLGSASASRMAEAQGRMNEDAQAALSILSQQLRMAGNNPKQPNYAPATPRKPVFPAGSYAIRGCDGAFSDVTTAASIATLTCTAAGPDAIAVAYEADPNNTVRNSAGNATDCLGQALPVTTVLAAAANHVKQWNPAGGAPPGTGGIEPTDVDFTLADNRFYIANTSGIPNLYCKGNGGANGQPLVENVEDLQVTYGVAPIAAVGTLTVAGYLTAKEVEDDEPNLQTLPDDATRWSKVATARICIVVRSELPVAPDAASAQYYQCDGTLNTTPPDLRLRRAYTTTVVLRNRLAS